MERGGILYKKVFYFSFFNEDFTYQLVPLLYKYQITVEAGGKRKVWRLLEFHMVGNGEGGPLSLHQVHPGYFQSETVSSWLYCI